MSVIVYVWDSHIKIVRQSSCSFQSWSKKNLSSSMDREAWCAAVHGLAKRTSRGHRHFVPRHSWNGSSPLGVTVTC